MKPSKRDAQIADALDQFLLLYQQLIAVVTPLVPPYFGFGSPTASYLDLLTSPEDTMLIADVARAAGRVSALGFSAHVEVHGSAMDPISNWTNSFVPNYPMSQQLVQQTALQGIGGYRSHAELAKVRERGLVGLVAQFARFPSDVREAAGFSSSAGQKGAFVVGVAVQVVASGIFLAITVAGGWLVVHVI